MKEQPKLEQRIEGKPRSRSGTNRNSHKIVNRLFVKVNVNVNVNFTIRE